MKIENWNILLVELNFLLVKIILIAKFKCFIGPTKHTLTV